MSRSAYHFGYHGHRVMTWLEAGAWVFQIEGWGRSQRATMADAVRGAKYRVDEINAAGAPD